MNRQIFDHFGLKILSLVIAFIIWVLVANIDDYQTTKQISGIEIEFINGDKITEKNKVYEVPVGQTVDIIVKGQRSVVEKLSSDDFSAVADLSKMSITNAVAVEVSAKSNAVAKELSITTGDTAVNVSVEDRLEKQLPITVRANSDVAEGYAIRTRTATPNLITVSGAESVVNMIAEVVVDIDVNGANHSLSAYAKPVFLDQNGEEIDASKFEYDVDEVAVSVEILKTKELKVRVKTTGEPKENYAIASIDYQPNTILVVGEASDLAKVDELLIDDVDVTNCDKDLETSVALADYLPNGIAMAESVEEVMIKVIIEKIEEKSVTIRTDDINLVGKKDDYTYSFSDEEPYQIKVRGLKDKLENLKVTDLIPSLDVTEYGPGTYTMTVEFRDVNGIEITEPLTVTLEIKAVQ